MPVHVLPLILGAAHGTADAVSGWLIGSISGDGSAGDVFFWLLVYNALAFAGQVPAGMLADRLGKPALLTFLGATCIAVSALISSTGPWFSVPLAGIGSAFFHSSGGKLVLEYFPGRTWAAGLFAAPGVAGLATGGWLAFQEVHPQYLFAAALLLLSASVFVFKRPTSSVREADDHHGAEFHDVVMFLLLFAIAFRSAVWNVFDHLFKGETAEMFILAGAAASGKAFGGFVSELSGGGIRTWRLWCISALAVSTGLLTAGGGNIWVTAPGIFLLQSATPAGITAMHRAMPRYAGIASGLAIGLAIAIGGIPFILKIPEEHLLSPPIVLISGTAALLLYAVALRPGFFRNHLPTHSGKKHSDTTP